jgi:hypothetical protein
MQNISQWQRNNQTPCLSCFGRQLPLFQWTFLFLWEQSVNVVRKLGQFFLLTGRDMAIETHMAIAMAELVSCNIPCSEFSLLGSYYIHYLGTELVLRLQDAVIPLVICALF